MSGVTLCPELSALPYLNRTELFMSIVSAQKSITHGREGEGREVSLWVLCYAHMLSYTPIIDSQLTPIMLAIIISVTWHTVLPEYHSLQSSG